MIAHGMLHVLSVGNGAAKRKVTLLTIVKLGDNSRASSVLTSRRWRQKNRLGYAEHYFEDKTETRLNFVWPVWLVVIAPAWHVIGSRRLN